MELEEIRRVIDLMRENDLAEFELEQEGLRIRIRRGPETVVQANGVYQAPAAPGVPAPDDNGSAAAPPDDGSVEIVSPIVGTFYRAPSPDSPPYVDLGSQIDAESVVCIVEAMKVMNEIKSEVRGSIVEILVENGAPVEFGQPLFRVRPA